MTTIAFDWDAKKAASNLAKHGVTFDEASTVFNDTLTLTIHDDDSTNEERWITLGEATTGRLIVVVHTWIDKGEACGSVRIISARRPTPKEIR